MFTVDQKKFPCLASLTMHFVGGKWKAVILMHLVDAPQRYNEIYKNIPTITERTLSLQLKQLEQDGLVLRKVYTEKPPLKVEYELTEFGKTLLPLLLEICKWGSVAVEKSDRVFSEVEE